MINCLMFANKQLVYYNDIFEFLNHLFIWIIFFLNLGCKKLLNLTRYSILCHAALIIYSSTYNTLYYANHNDTGYVQTYFFYYLKMKID